MIYTVTLNPALDRELTVPALVENEVLRATRSQVDFGGKGFNVSRMIASLGGESIAVGFVGGKSGEQLQDGLIAAGIQTEFVWLAEETRTNVSIVSNGRYIKVNESGPTVTKTQLSILLKRIQSLAKAGDWWVLSGSLPPGVADDAYAQITAVLKKRKAHVYLDSSGTPLQMGCQAGPDWVKPNESELEALTGLADPLAGTAVMQSIGAKNIAVTLGKAGCLVVTKNESWLGKSPQIEEKNPIGAGDSFVGGMVWALASKKTAVEAVQWGLACGAATASLSGTTIGTLNQVTALKEQVDVEEQVAYK